MDGLASSLRALPLNTQCVVDVSYWTLVQNAHFVIVYKNGKECEIKIIASL